MSDRGMKKWAPYSSLIEQSTCLEKMRYQKNKIEKPILSEDEIEHINQILTSYNGEDVEISYFFDGYIYTIVTKIKRIDIYNKKLIFKDGYLPFDAILNINYINSNNFDF